MIQAVRGAIQIDENNAEKIRLSVIQLVTTIASENELPIADIVSIQFTQTKDLTALNPATALRTEGFSDVPLFCSQEPGYDGALPRMIRVLVTYRSEAVERPTPVYLNGAEKLRSDLFSG